MLTPPLERLPTSDTNRLPTSNHRSEFLLAGCRISKAWQMRLEQAAARVRVRLNCYTTDEAMVADVAGTRPTVVVLPLSKQLDTAIELLQQLQGQLSAACVLFVCDRGQTLQSTDAADLAAIFRLGAVDLLSEKVDDAELDRCLIDSFLCSERRRGTLQQVRAARRALQTLTQRQLDVLDLLMHGCTNKVIAHRLEISPKTVEKHRHRITVQTQCSSLPHLARLTILARCPLDVIYSMQTPPPSLEPVIGN